METEGGKLEDAYPSRLGGRQLGWTPGHPQDPDAGYNLPALDLTAHVIPQFQNGRHTVALHVMDALVEPQSPALATAAHYSTFYVRQVRHAMWALACCWVFGCVRWCDRLGHEFHVVVCGLPVWSAKPHAHASLCRPHALPPCSCCHSAPSSGSLGRTGRSWVRQWLCR